MEKKKKDKENKKKLRKKQKDKRYTLDGERELVPMKEEERGEP